MPASVALSAASLPLLAAAIVALMALATSLVLEPRDARGRLLTGAYRRLAAVNAAFAALAFLSLNRDATADWVPRALLFAAAALVPALNNVRRAADARRGGWQEPAAWAALAACAVALFLDRGWFVAGSRPSRLGFSEIVPGPWLALALVAGFAAGVVTVARLNRPRADGALRALGLGSIALLAAGAADAIAMLAGLDRAPVSWLGSALLSYSVARGVRDEGRAASRFAAEAEARRASLEQRLIRDELTGLYTRAFGMEAVERAMVERGGACVVFIDLDDFKVWNDHFSHAVGDEVLRMVARVVRDSARAEDTPARYAGDEFFVVLPTSRLEAGLRVAEVIRTGLTALPPRDGLRVTASLGVARALPDETAAELLDRADRAAYRAKRDGKDRVSSTHT